MEEVQKLMIQAGIFFVCILLIQAIAKWLHRVDPTIHFEKECEALQEQIETKRMFNYHESEMDITDIQNTYFKKVDPEEYRIRITALKRALMNRACRDQYIIQI